MPVPSATQIARLKMMTDATMEPVLSDAEVTAILEMYFVADADGTAPSGDAWPLIDWYGAAEYAWNIKHGRAATLVNTNADGQQYSLSDVAERCKEQRQYYAALRQTGTITTQSFANG